MALPDSSETVASGGVIATHTVAGKEYQVVMAAGPSGHILESLPTYHYWRPYTAGAANQITIDFFNAVGSGKIAKMRKLFVHHNQAAITGVGHVFSFDRTSAVGTGGTVITGRTVDSINAAIPSQITARFNATGGATLSHVFFGLSSDPEETRPGASIAPMINWLPEGTTFQDVVCREGEGIRVQQITSNTAGVWGCLLVVTLE